MQKKDVDARDISTPNELTADAGAPGADPARSAPEAPAPVKTPPKLLIKPLSSHPESDSDLRAGPGGELARFLCYFI